MSYHYSDPSRENEKYALPNVDVFYADKGDWWIDQNGERCDAPTEDGAPCEPSSGEEPCEAGWYYWYCFPGCMPDSEPFGPFESEEAAVANARENAE